VIWRPLRKEQPTVPIPLRSTVPDIGPMLSHRVQIVRLALAGKTMTEICQQMRHSPAAVANYLATFTRVAQLAKQNCSQSDLFLLRRGRGLIECYLELLNKRMPAKTRLRLPAQRTAFARLREREKKSARRRTAMNPKNRLPPQKDFAPMLEKS